MTGDKRILLGIVGAAHGIRGEVRLKAFTATPTDIAAYGPLTDDRGRLVEIERVRPLKADMVVVKLKGVDDRTSAAALKGVSLFVDRACLPDTGVEEYYHADLIGLEAVLRDGSSLGRVVAIFDHGAGDIIEIAGGAEDAPLLLPFTRAAVPEIDISGGRILVDPPAATAPRQGQAEG